MPTVRRPWGYDERLNVLRQIAGESRSTNPVAAVAAIAEYNRMLEAAARNPALLSDAAPDKPDEALPNVFTPATLAERWGCSHRHVRNLIDDGKLNCFRLGGKLVRILTAEVLDYEARTYVGPEAADPVQEEISSAEQSQARQEALAEPNSAANAKTRKKPAPRLDTPAMRARWRMQQEQSGK